MPTEMSTNLELLQTLMNTEGVSRQFWRFSGPLRSFKNELLQTRGPNYPHICENVQKIVCLFLTYDFQNMHIIIFVLRS